MNVVQLSGRLTRDPELRYVGATDFPILMLNLGVEDGEGRWDRESGKTLVGSGFYRVEVPGRYGEGFASILSKGDSVYVLGSLQQFTTGGRDGGERQSKTQVRATMIMPLTEAREPAPDITPPDAPMFDEEPF